MPFRTRSKYWRFFVVLLLAGVLSFVIWQVLTSPPSEGDLATFRGKSLADVVEQLGEPSHEGEFPLGWGGEMQVELMNYYPGYDVASQQVSIRELRWEKYRCALVIWFHECNGEWVALDTYVWHAGVVH